MRKINLVTDLPFLKILAFSTIAMNTHLILMQIAVLFSHSLRLKTSKASLKPSPVSTIQSFICQVPLTLTMYHRFQGWQRLVIISSQLSLLQMRKQRELSDSTMKLSGKIRIRISDSFISIATSLIMQLLVYASHNWSLPLLTYSATNFLKHSIVKSVSWLKTFKDFLLLKT